MPSSSRPRPWSDGKPVTGRTFARRGVFINPANNVISRTGWEDVKSIKGSGKKAVLVFKKRTPTGRPSPSGVYPAHIIQGQDMNKMFLTSIPSPAVRGASTAGRRVCSWPCEERAFTAGPKLKLDRVVFRYILDTNARFQALKAGEGQVMEPQPQLQIADFLKDKKFVVDQKIGYAWEHVDIQFGPQGHLALKQPYVRQALITGINRSRSLVPCTRRSPLDCRLLTATCSSPSRATTSRTGLSTSSTSRRSSTSFRRRVAPVGRASPANNQSIFSCPDVGKLSFRFGTTTGNQLRALAFEIMQRQLKSVGIELVARFQVAGTLFGTTLPSGDWDLVMFTWVGSPSTPITIKDLYACGGDQNYMNYCNKAGTAIMNAVAGELDAAQRAKMLNSTELKHMVKDIPSIPLFARPIYVIRANTVKAPWSTRPARVALGTSQTGRRGQPTRG